MRRIVQSPFSVNALCGFDGKETPMTGKMENAGKKSIALNATCMGLALATAVGLVATGASMARMLSDGSMAYVQAAQNEADDYMVSLRDEVDRLRDEQLAAERAALEKAIADAEQRQKDALEDHIRDADSRFKNLPTEASSTGSGSGFTGNADARPVPRQKGRRQTLSCGQKVVLQ